MREKPKERERMVLEFIAQQNGWDATKKYETSNTFRQAMKNRVKKEIRAEERLRIY